MDLDSILTGANVVQGGAVTVLLAAVVAVLRGWIVPRRVLEDVRADRDAAVDAVRADRDARVAESVARENQWREAYLMASAAEQMRSEQVDQLLDASRTTVAVVQALHSAASGKGAP